MTESIQQVGAVHAKNDMNGVDNPGTFTAFEDDSAIFCGNDSITPNQATGHYLNWMAVQDATLTPFSDNSAASTYGAQFMLQQNQHLNMTNVDAAIPKGELFHIDGKSLKQLLAPFANRLDELRSMIAQTSGGIDGNAASNQVLGKTRTPGTGIPLV
ncbi:MAG: hypothetical protein JW841_10030 [Deltaproteobacteria bacterium]|nr:hypothetical protein [Deltaproteobacteria bacterium]